MLLLTQGLLLQFIYPNVLLFILVPILILIFLIATKKSKLSNIFDKEILEKLSISNKHFTKTTRNTLLFISLVLMTFSLARPVINEKEQNIKQEITPIIVAIDVSKSMLANDIFPSRIAMAKNKLLRLMQNSKDIGLGVTLFAKSAFILSPVTQDFNSLAFLVNNFDNNLNFDSGSNILAVIEASSKLLKDYKSKNIILLSDGGNNTEFDDEIKFANENNINIYTIAIATNKPTPIPIKDGYLTDDKNNIITVALNENIKKLSLATNAGYINYTLNDDDILAIVNDIREKSEKIKLKSQKYKIYTELFYYPLALALFILLVAFSSLPKKANLLLLTLVLMNHTQSTASILDFKTIEEANKAYSKKEYDKSYNSFQKLSNTSEAKYNSANSLYKNNKYKEALKQYQKVVTSNQDLEFNKLHNMGNTYVKLNDLKNAEKMYEKALNIKEDKDTKDNLETVKKALKNKKNKQDKKNKQENKKDSEKKNDEKKEQESKNNKQDKNEKKSGEEKNAKDKKQNKNKKEDINSKKDEKENSKDKKQNKDKKNSSQNISEKTMTDLEEKKWLDLIKNQKAPIMLRKVESKSQKDDSLTPW